MNNIVQRALEYGVTDVGQLTKEEVTALNAAMRKGTLSKTKNFTYPIDKPMWVRRLPWDTK